MTDFDVAIAGGHIIDSDGSNNLSADLTSTIIQKPNTRRIITFDIYLDNTNAVGKIYIKRSCSGVQYFDQILPDDSTFITVSSGVDVVQTFDFGESAAPLWKIFYDFTSGNGKLDVYAVTCE
jgi:hypothetical protein